MIMRFNIINNTITMTITKNICAKVEFADSSKIIMMKIVREK